MPGHRSQPALKPSVRPAWRTTRRSGPALASALLLGAFIVGSEPSMAESTGETDVSGAPDIATRDTLFGDMGGLRPAAEARGLSFDAVAIGDYSIVLDGGADPRATAARYLIEAGIELDTEAALGWPGGTLRASYLGFHGDNGNLDSGDIQVYSNIDETPLDAFYSLWYRQDLFDERLAVKLGKMDANEDFAYVDNGDQFLNSSPGFSPTILAFPSYPDPATAIALFAELPGGVYARAGLYDGSSLNGRRTGTRGPDNFLGDDSDRFSVGEVGLDYSWADRDGRLGLGYWRHDGDFARFDGGMDDSSDGLYLVWDQSLYEDPASSLAVDGFAQYGQAGRRTGERIGHAYRRRGSGDRPGHRPPRRCHRLDGQPGGFLRRAGRRLYRRPRDRGRSLPCRTAHALDDAQAGFPVHRQSRRNGPGRCEGRHAARRDRFVITTGPA